jgi:hypothetical protein
MEITTSITWIVMVLIATLWQCITAAQGKQVYVLNVLYAFRTTVQFDASKRTYNMLPPFFAEYIRLHWPYHPDLPAISDYPKLYAIHNFRSMQGQKDVGCQWYHLIKGSLGNIGLYLSVADHEVFTWNESIADLL